MDCETVEPDTWHKASQVTETYSTKVLDLMLWFEVAKLWRPEFLYVFGPCFGQRLSTYL